MTPESATASPVRVRSLVAGYDGRPVLHGVDLTVSPGEIVAVLGANGSGKSTLVKAVVGLVPAEAGSVEVFGVPVSRFRQRSRLGYVPQRVTAASGVPATVREVVESGRLPRRRPLAHRTAEDRTAVAEALDRVGLTQRAHDSVARLSGGQQQRVLIARALAGEPDLLVLDEPTAGIDLPSQEILARTLADLATSGRSVLLVAHELGPLLPIIDRAVVLRGGHVVHDGPLDDRLAHVVESDHVHAHDPSQTHDLWGMR